MKENEVKKIEKYSATSSWLKPDLKTHFHIIIIGGHGGRVVTLSPPTSAAGVRSPS